MKKIILYICGAAIIALAAINMNFAHKSESNANLSLESLISLAKGEDGVKGKCTQAYGHYQGGNYVYLYYDCFSGVTECFKGYILYVNGSYYDDTLEPDYSCD